MLCLQLLAIPLCVNLMVSGRRVQHAFDVSTEISDSPRSSDKELASFLLSLSPPHPGINSHSAAPQARMLSRRDALRNAFVALQSGTILGGLKAPAFAEERYLDDMGGKLDSFTEPIRGYKIYIPVGWDSSESMSSYNPGRIWKSKSETESSVRVCSSPAKQKNIKELGDLRTIGSRYAEKENAQLLGSFSGYADDGSPIYAFELLGEDVHELLAVTINQGKLFEVRAATSNALWNKYKQMYKKIIISFEPEVQSYEYTIANDQDLDRTPVARPAVKGKTWLDAL